ncbi:MAG: metallophosphoesterase [Clostridia bacterium]|nr:metallophosphoesterase [Clostridia bacterium]
MKKIFTFFLFALIATFCCVACTMTPSGGSGSDESVSASIESVSDSQESEIPHEHGLVFLNEEPATCSKAGRRECYFCWNCKGYFADEDALIELTEEDLAIPKISHVPEKQESVDPTCYEAGVIEHWVCTECNARFMDAECTERVNLSDVEIPNLPHDTVFNEGYPIDGENDGMIDHWKCNNCGKYFTDAECTVEITPEETVLRSFISIPDFIVEIPEGKDPVILQLSDTQIIDGAQTRSESSGGDRITYDTWKIQYYCYDYLTEIITETKPDFIILTGDLVYGKYDDNGTVLQSLIAFMDSFEIPWAAVLGNHESESYKGVDWQCEQLENAEYGLFKQRELMGNGNYSVGILQGGKVTRMFFMLDSNGNSTACQESLNNGHTSKSVGFFNSQIEWYTSEIEEMKAQSPETKYSFVFHIQMAVFGDAFAKYGFDQSVKDQGIDIDGLENKAEGDFGYIGRQMKDAWDNSRTVYEGMKALGVDSIFVGHEHCNSASVVYEGIRFQYGQKSSEYDRHNAVDANGNIVENQIWSSKGTPIIGGSVIILSAVDGTITDGYIYYCQNTSEI